MKDAKYFQTTAHCWSYRHELIGLILLVIATFLTVITCNSFGIVAMFVAGVVFCCYKHFCCCHHHNGACHSSEEACSPLDEKKPVKKAVAKAKK